MQGNVILRLGDNQVISLGFIPVKTSEEIQNATEHRFVFEWEKNE